MNEPTPFTPQGPADYFLWALGIIFGIGSLVAWLRSSRDKYYDIVIAVVLIAMIVGGLLWNAWATGDPAGSSPW